MAETNEMVERVIDGTRIVSDPTGPELADRIEAWLRGGHYRPGDNLPGSLQASIGSLVCSHLPLVLAGLRALPPQPDPS
ncbi:hypothetical protein [Methylobacterium thuringiense]|uniref:Uncharacterized protein n=1 Tax=Methylobacterium thuringiense TaxID=1003091 RepID=A0ABQ4TIZ0_9HYPH|nr:hypothetical protein [Methylobacterium thuringiense]GJE55246.1 hypothetical protein EKPJFOCH_1735 [Methylobacterium thuringiense]